MGASSSTQHDDKEKEQNEILLVGDGWVVGRLNSHSMAGSSSGSTCKTVLTYFKEGTDVAVRRAVSTIDDFPTFQM